jgi:hypothetical protein
VSSSSYGTCVLLLIRHMALWRARERLYRSQRTTVCVHVHLGFSLGFRVSQRPTGSLNPKHKHTQVLQEAVAVIQRLTGRCILLLIETDRQVYPPPQTHTGAARSSSGHSETDRQELLKAKYHKSQGRGKRVFITYAQGTFFGMSEPGEASKRR